MLAVPCAWGWALQEGTLASPPRSSLWHPVSQSHCGTPAKRDTTSPSSARSRGRGKRRRQQRGEYLREYLTFIFSSSVVFQSWRRAVRGAAPPPAPCTSPGLSALFPRRGLGQETLGPSQGRGAAQGPRCWQQGTAGAGTPGNGGRALLRHAAPCSVLCHWESTGCCLTGSSASPAARGPLQFLGSEPSHGDAPAQGWSGRRGKAACGEGSGTAPVKCHAELF